MEEKLIFEYIKSHYKELKINPADVVGIKKINEKWDGSLFHF